MGVRTLNKLSDRGLKTWIAQARTGQKRADGGGLFLTLTPAGTPAWRIKYRLNRKERLYAVGTYPSVSLEGAREARELVKAHLREGRDPVVARRVEKAAATTASDNTFGAVADDWFAKQRGDRSEVHYRKSKRAFDRDVRPLLGRLPVAEITTPMLAAIIESIRRRGARDTAAKVLWHCSSVFRLAQARGLCSANPAEPVKELLDRKKKTTPMPAVLNLPGLGEILRGARQARLSRAVYLAHRLCAFSAARISNVAQAEWKEFDLDASPPMWIIPRAKMKARDRHHDHKIILPQTIVAELREWRELWGGRGYVFPSRDGRSHISRESVEKAYRVTLKLADKHTPHGWRAAFSTLARDHDFDRDVVELVLDHIHDNEVVRAYDRGERLQQRVKLMAWWGDQLVRAEHGSDVVPIRASHK